MMRSEIPMEVGKKDGVPMQYDFRDIYGTVLEQWFETDRSLVGDILHPDYTTLPIIQGCQTTSGQEFSLQSHLLEIQVAPNPFHELTNLSFRSGGERMSVTLYDHLGYEIIRLADKIFPEGEHLLPIRMDNLPVGSYFVRVVSAASNGVKSLVKI